MNSQEQRPINRIGINIFRSQILLIVILTALITVAGIALNLYYEGKRLDQNLQNVAETIATSQLICNLVSDHSADNHYPVTASKEYLDTLQKTLSNIDVISVVGTDKVRRYHSTPDYIGTVYDGTIPEFIQEEREFYASSDHGPSGSQRRAYAAIYDENGTYLGFVMAVMLQENIMRTTMNMLVIYLLSAAVAVGVAVLTSIRLSGRIKEKLLGYEPDAFSAMFMIRDNILESLEEGILAVDSEERIVFLNRAAAEMLNVSGTNPIGKKLCEICPASALGDILQNGRHEFNVPLKLMKNTDILCDRMPILEKEQIVGAVSIFRNRTEYTKLMEDLTGVRYMVDSMRASNHDFTNKLHVILGLIQMEQYKEAERYIMNVTLVERKMIHSIMHAIDEPSVAALLIGKLARASELNIRFSLKTGSSLNRTDVEIPAGSLVTLIGNLLDNAMDAMNAGQEQPGELTIGIFSNPHTVVITVDDTGTGISPNDMEHIFEYGYSTKGEGRGTGLYLVKTLVDSCGGNISVDSEPGTGTSFIVTLKG